MNPALALPLSSWSRRFRHACVDFRRNAFRASTREGLALALVVFALPVQGEVAYRFVDLGTLGGNHSVASDVNNAGQIIGTSEATPGGDRLPRIWNALVPQEIDARAAYPVAINNLGHVVGTDDTGLPTIFLGGGKRVELDTLPEPYAYWQVKDINDRDQVVGSIGRRAVIWNGTEPTVLPSLHGNPYFRSVAFAINNAGQVVGQDDSGLAMLWAGGLGHALPGGGTAVGINDEGTIVGGSRFATGRVGPVAWLNGGARVELGPPEGGGFALDINNRGQIVGRSEGALPYRATLWDLNGSATDLNTFAAGTGWHLPIARAINDQGWIVGEAFREGQYTDGLWHAYALIPIPEPGTHALLLAGLLTIALAVRLRTPSDAAKARAPA